MISINNCFNTYTNSLNIFLLKNKHFIEHKIINSDNIEKVIDVPSYVGPSRKKKPFQAEMERMKDYPFSFIICEFSMDDLLKYPENV